MEDDNERQRCRRYIRITDEEMWKKIDHIMELPDYKSFNKVVNDAMFYGLDILIMKLFDGAGEPLENPVEEVLSLTQPGIDNDTYKEVISLMREMLLNILICKSSVNSLFRAKSLELQRNTADATAFVGGRYADTPDHLKAFEKRTLEQINRSRRKS